MYTARLWLSCFGKIFALRLLPFFLVPFFVMAAGFLYLNFFEKRMTGIETGGEAIGGILNRHSWIFNAYVCFISNFKD